MLSLANFRLSCLRLLFAFSLLVVSLPAHSQTIANSSFETPQYTNGFAFNPTPTLPNWIFAGDSGIQSNGGFLQLTDPSLHNAPLPGSQTAFIESYPGTTTGSISQSINFPITGTYTISYMASGWRGVSEPLQISVDGVAVGAVTPSPESYTS